MWKPACYSKFQTIERIKQALKDNPTQKYIPDKTFEITDNGHTVARLDEIYKYLKHIQLTIQCKNGFVTVLRKESGEWVVL